MLSAGGLEVGRDFHLAFSPERVDPGNTRWRPESVPKIVGGITDACTERAAELYQGAIDQVHRVSSPEAAELTKLLENIFRSVNIALVNELAQLCDRMGIDVWEVVDAASTKPFGFMRFEPGPGLGGHCIPIDPFYLTWKAREYGFYTEFIELAGKVNENMPYYCRSLISQALNHGRQRSLKGSKVLVLGVAYKPDISDTRESPALKVIELLRNAGSEVAYHDPHVPSLPGLGLESVELDPAAYDCVDRRHRPLGHRLRPSRRRRAPRRRLSQCDGRERAGAPTRSGSFEHEGRGGGPRLLGPQPRAKLRHTRRASVGLRLGQRRRRAHARPLSPGTDDDRLRRAARRRRARRGRRGDTGADARRSRAASARGGQARARREAAGDDGRGDRRPRRARRASATSC